MDSNELLDALKAHTGAATDNALARQILKVDPTSLKAMRKRGVSDERALQIAAMLEIDPGAVLAAVHAERAKDPAVKEVWESLVKTLASRAAAALGAFGMLVSLTVGAPQPAEAAQHLSRYTLCEVRALRRALGIWLAILASLGLFAGPVCASDWTRDDTAWQAGYLALHVADWGQTRNIVRRADTGCDGDPLCIERNPILGRNPSIKRVDTYFAFTALAHTAISYALPPDWRRSWQLITIGVEAGVVGYNYKLGLKMDF